MIDHSSINAKYPEKIRVMMAMRKSIIFPEKPSWKAKNIEFKIWRIFEPNKYIPYR